MTTTDTTVHEAPVAVDQGSLDDLVARLGRTRWPDELAGVGWEAGIPVARTRELAEAWAAYDWPGEVERLNQHGPVATTIDGQRVHAFTAAADDPDAPALLLLHGWPSTAADLLPLVAALRGRFHLVAPSLPGFGFSGPTTERGWSPRRMAGALAELMGRLGHERFLVRGEDTGTIVGRHLATSVPERVLGLHVTDLAGTPEPAPDEVEGEEAERAAALQLAGYTKSGYAMVQAQAPQTLAYGLHDSPVGLLAWIGEKHLCWSGPRTSLSDEDVLRTASIYWHTATLASSARAYWEGAAEWGGEVERVEVPTAVQVFADPLGLPVRSAVERYAHVVRWREEGDAAGHFPMLEATDRVAEDLVAFAAEVG